MRSTILFVFVASSLLACADKPPQTVATLPSSTSPRPLAIHSIPASTVTRDVRFTADSLQVYATAEAKSSRGGGGFMGILSGGGGSSASTTPSSQLPGSAEVSSSEMIEIEARFSVQCDSVNACADAFRTLVQTSGGRTTSDESSTNKETDVTFAVRVPAERFESFVGGLHHIGAVQGRDVKRRDVSKEFHDTELLLHERDAARERYEELLKAAKDVKETMEVEQQLDRLRTEIDRIKSDMAWFKDRVASATITVRFFPSATSEDAVFAPSATLFPAVRATMLFDLRSESQRNGYVGGGLSVQFKPFGRALTFDIDIARSAIADKPTVSDYAYIFLTGFDLYSELLGGGRRKLLNPFIGFRAGYAITNGSGDFAFGGVVGVDIVKTKAVMLDLHAKVLGLVGNDAGPHVMVGPELAFSFAF